MERVKQYSLTCLSRFLSFSYDCFYFVPIEASPSHLYHQYWDILYVSMEFSLKSYRVEIRGNFLLLKSFFPRCLVKPLLFRKPETRALTIEGWLKSQRKGKFQEQSKQRGSSNLTPRFEVWKQRDSWYRETRFTMAKSV